MVASSTVPRYGARITTVDPAQGIVGAFMKGDAQERRISVYTTDVAFRWPQVGEAWMVCQMNGTWYLEGLWPEFTFQNVNPGDLVLNTPTGVIHVLGSKDGSTDFQFNANTYLPKTNIARGNITMTWSGGTPVSNALTIPHGLGVIPGSYSCISNSVPGDGFTVLVSENSPPDATNLHVQGRTITDFQPANTATNTVRWLAIK